MHQPADPVPGSPPAGPPYVVGPTTNRLSHRALEPSDAEAFFRLNSDPAVMEHTGEPPLGSVEAARAAIESYPDFGSVGYGRWGCFSRESGELIGFCGLKYLADLDVVDVGYRLFPAFWGRGLATEACAASVAFGFEVLGLKRIVAFVLPANPGSMAVLAKCGFVSDGPVQLDGLSVEHWSIEAG